MGNVIRTFNLRNEDDLTLEKSESRIVYSIINVLMPDHIQLTCTTGVCDVICGAICDVICDSVCSGICDGVCDRICDVFCDRVSVCDTDFVCDSFCDRVIA